MEPMKHTEWGMGFFLLFLSITNPRLDLQLGIYLMFFLVGTQLPDYSSYLLKIYLKLKWERRISHEFLTWMVPLLSLLLIDEFLPLIRPFTWLFAGAFLHMCIDLFSGCEHPYIFQRPFIILSEKFHVKFGAKIQQWGAKYIVDEETKTNADLAWFWFVQLSSVLWVVITLMIYSTLHPTSVIIP